jgi:DNA polymerase-1
MTLESFKEIWLADFEFHQLPGERPTPICMVAMEFRTGKTIRLFDPFPKTLPFNQSGDNLFVAYFAPAELSCYLALAWPFPANVLDLYAEFRLSRSGLTTLLGFDLLGAQAHFKIECIESAEKASMRDLAKRGGPFTNSEIAALIEYCATDVVALTRLLPAMAPCLDFPRCLIRGQYTKAVADIEFRGIPIDVPRLQLLLRDWEKIQLRLIQEIDVGYGVFEGLTFKRDRLEKFLLTQHIPWPRLPSGALALDDSTFKEMARAYPIIMPIREARRSLSQLRLNEFAIGSDGRHRFMLSPFRSKTGRNQPSTSKFIFNGPAWVRNLIIPETGKALAYIDYAQQEFGIAAALSGDENMLKAYSSGDPYLQFAIMAGAVPREATKQSHPIERELFKTCQLGVQYGMEADSLAMRINRSPAHARELIDLHRRTFPKYWAWSDRVQDFAMLYGKLTATFGWQVHVGTRANPRSLRNFPVQANGAEMLRLGCILCRERDVQICAPVHDASLIEADIDAIHQAAAACQQAMSDASAVVLGGFRLRTDVKIITKDNPFDDPRGRRMWEIISKLITNDDQHPT